MSANPRVPNRIGEQKFPFLSNFETGITAGTTQTQAGATQLVAQISRVDTVAVSGDGVKLPKMVVSPGRLGSVGSILFVGNNGANAMKLYGGLLDTINGVASGTGNAIAAGVNVWLAAVSFNPSTGVGTWLMTNSQAAAVAAITSGTIDGVTVTNSTIKSFVQGAPAAKTVTATLSGAEVFGGLITANPGASTPATYTFPLGSDLATAVGTDVAIGSAFMFRAVNISTDAAEDVTFAGNTGTTLVGSGAMASNAAATDKSAATFLIRRTGASAFSIYRST